MNRQVNSAANITPTSSPGTTVSPRSRNGMPRHRIHAETSSVAPIERSAACQTGEMPRLPTLAATCPSPQIMHSTICVATTRGGRAEEELGTSGAIQDPRAALAAMPVRTPEASVRDALAALRDALQRCRECPLGYFATQAVAGEGALRPALMLVGEVPGDQEDLQGHPFVGPAGQLLFRATDSLGWPREALFVTNAVKHFKF